MMKTGSRFAHILEKGSWKFISSCFPYLSRWPIQASQADKFEAELRKLRELLGELEFLRSRVDELRADNHLLLEAKQQLEDQLASRDRDMTSLVELDKELSHYKQLLQRSTEVAYRARWFYID